MTPLHHDTETIAIVPARGGSKGVPLKNLRPLNGIPLVAFGVLCAVRAKAVSRTVVSTDHQGIAEVALHYGAEVVIRPQGLASDTSPVVETMQHVVRVLESQGARVGYMALVQCTSPFRLAADVDAGFALLSEGSGDAVMSVSEVPAHFHPCWMKRVNQAGYLESLMIEKGAAHPILESSRYIRRQDLPGTYYWKNGALYIVDRDCLMDRGHLFGTACLPLLIDGGRLVNIDTEADLANAEHLLASGKVELDFLP